MIHLVYVSLHNVQFGVQGIAIMSFQEKRSLVSLVSSIVIAVGYFQFMFQRAAAHGVSTTDDLRFWAELILILVPVYVVFKVMFHVIFVVINAVATREAAPDITDEFDRLVELKSTRNFYHVFMVGFMLSLVVLVMEQPPYIMFVVLIVAVLAAIAMQEISQLYYYRRGV